MFAGLLKKSSICLFGYIKNINGKTSKYVCFDIKNSNIFVWIYKNSNGRTAQYVCLDI